MKSTSAASHASHASHRRPSLEKRRASVRALSDQDIADVLSKPAPKRPDAAAEYAMRRNAPVPFGTFA